MIAITLHIIWTIVALTLFVGIVIWAWSSKRKQEFDAMAHLPLEEDQEIGVRARFSPDTLPEINSVGKIGL